MKILELRPASGELLPRFERLVEALRARGVDVERWDGAADGTVALAQRFAAGGFDVAHAHGDLSPSALAHGRVPVVTTLYRAPTDPEAAFLSALEPPPALVQAFDGEAGPLAFRARVSTDTEADEYAELFPAVVAEHAAHRADAQHDERPWGAYWVLDDQPAFKVKRIHVCPGKRLSYQRHERRSEHWLVVSGRARVTLDGSEHELGPGDAIDIEAGQAHRMANPGPDELVFIEVQRGTYFGEDDIERLDDDFGRTGV